MRVALVYRGRYHIRQAMDLEILAPLLRQERHRVDFVYDSNTFGVTDNVIQMPRLARVFSSTARVLKRITTSKPEVVVFSVLPSTYKWSQQVASKLKDRTSVPIVFLGLFPSLVPEQAARDAFVDYVIQGEAENAINPLLEAIAGRKDPAEVGNLWYRQENQIKFTHQAPFADLDSLPIPDKELFSPYVSHCYSYATFVSRGCTYNCTYCEESCLKKAFGPRYFRRKSVDSVISELVMAKKRYGFREVIFKDSYLSGNKKWLADLMRQYREKIGVPFKCFCTIIGFDNETARLLKEGGCYCIEFGLQTWNEQIRRDILRRKENNEDVFKAFKYCAEQRLWYDVDHMFDLPYEQPQDHLNGTLCYRQLKYLNRVKVHRLVYYPTAEIVDHGLASRKLAAEAQERLMEGSESDFYDQQDDNRENEALVSGYATLYKILPLMPDSLLRWFVRGDRIRLLRLLPSPILVLLQLMVALRSGDLRFWAYLGFYPRKVAISVKDSLLYRLANLISKDHHAAKETAI
jgi:radical SAM superfamily enzyme YgiQ (UPF0313 family)